MVYNNQSTAFRTNGIIPVDLGVRDAILRMSGLTGNIYWVHSSGSNANNGLSSGTPVATIDYAIGLCTANQGDTIYVMPGHAESLSGAGAIAADIAGISIIGLGVGSQRPLITLHTVATTIAVSAANITFRNLRIATDVDAVVKIFNITAAGCTIDAVDFVETAACAALQFALTTAAADDLTISNCVHIQTQTAATALQQWIVLTGADRFKLINCYIKLKGFGSSNPANGVIVGVTTASLDVLLQGNTLISLNSTGAVVISMLAGSDGFARQNYVASAKTAIAGSIALASLFGAENYASHVVNKNGLLEPVVDA